MDFDFGACDDVDLFAGASEQEVNASDPGEIAPNPTNQRTSEANDFFDNFATQNEAVATTNEPSISAPNEANQHTEDSRPEPNSDLFQQEPSIIPPTNGTKTEEKSEESKPQTPSRRRGTRQPRNVETVGSPRTAGTATRRGVRQARRPRQIPRGRRRPVEHALRGVEQTQPPIVSAAEPPPEKPAAPAFDFGDDEFGDQALYPINPPKPKPKEKETEPAPSSLTQDFMDDFGEQPAYPVAKKQNDFMDDFGDEAAYPVAKNNSDLFMDDFGEQPAYPVTKTKDNPVNDSGAPAAQPVPKKPIEKPNPAPVMDDFGDQQPYPIAKTSPPPEQPKPDKPKSMRKPPPKVSKTVTPPAPDLPQRMGHRRPTRRRPAKRVPEKPKKVEEPPPPKPTEPTPDVDDFGEQMPYPTPKASTPDPPPKMSDLIAPDEDNDDLLVARKPPPKVSKTTSGAAPDLPQRMGHRRTQRRRPGARPGVARRRATGGERRRAFHRPRPGETSATTTPPPEIHPEPSESVADPSAGVSETPMQAPQESRREQLERELQKKKDERSKFMQERNFDAIRGISREISMLEQELEELNNEDADSMGLMGAIGSWFIGGTQSDQPRASEPPPPTMPKSTDASPPIETAPDPPEDDPPEDIDEMVLKDKLEEVLGTKKNTITEFNNTYPCPTMGTDSLNDELNSPTSPILKETTPPTATGPAEPVSFKKAKAVKKPNPVPLESPSGLSDLDAAFKRKMKNKKKLKADPSKIRLKADPASARLKRENPRRRPPTPIVRVKSNSEDKEKKEPKVATPPLSNLKQVKNEEKVEKPKEVKQEEKPAAKEKSTRAMQISDITASMMERRKKRKKRERRPMRKQRSGESTSSEVTSAADVSTPKKKKFDLSSYSKKVKQKAEEPKEATKAEEKKTDFDLAAYSKKVKQGNNDTEANKEEEKMSVINNTPPIIQKTTVPENSAVLKKAEEKKLDEKTVKAEDSDSKKDMKSSVTATSSFSLPKKKARARSTKKGSKKSRTKKTESDSKNSLPSKSGFDEWFKKNVKPKGLPPQTPPRPPNFPKGDPTQPSPGQQWVDGLPKLPDHEPARASKSGSEDRADAESITGYSDLSVPSNISSMSKMSEEKRNMYIQRAKAVRNRYKKKYIKKSKDQVAKQTKHLEEKIQLLEKKLEESEKTKKPIAISPEEMKKEAMKNVYLDFEQFGFSEDLLQVVRSSSSSSRTVLEVHSSCIPDLLQGKDLYLCAASGSGKTLAFLLPLLQRVIDRRKTDDGLLRGLIVTHTREQAKRLRKQIEKYEKALGLRVALLTSGVWSDAVKQENLVRQKPDIIVSTPSRLWEFLGKPRVKLTLENLEMLVVISSNRVIQLCQESIRGIFSYLPKPEKRHVQTVISTSQYTPELNGFVSKLIKSQHLITPNVVEIAEEVPNPEYDPNTVNEELNMGVLDNTTKLQKALHRKFELVEALSSLVGRFQSEVSENSIAAYASRGSSETSVIQSAKEKQLSEKVKSLEKQLSEKTIQVNLLQTTQEKLSAEVKRKGLKVQKVDIEGKMVISQLKEKLHFAHEDKIQIRKEVEERHSILNEELRKQINNLAEENARYRQLLEQNPTRQESSGGWFS